VGTGSGLGGAGSGLERLWGTRLWGTDHGFPVSPTPLRHNDFGGHETLGAVIGDR
jgi:hypothetical protein